MGILVAIAGILVPLLPNLLATANNATGAVNVTELNKEVQTYAAVNSQKYPDGYDSLVDSERRDPIASIAQQLVQRDGRQRSERDDLDGVRSHEPEQGGHHNGLQSSLCQRRHDGRQCNLPRRRYDDGYGRDYADGHAPFE